MSADPAAMMRARAQATLEAIIDRIGPLPRSYWGGRRRQQAIDVILAVLREQDAAARAAVMRRADAAKEPPA